MKLSLHCCTSRHLLQNNIQVLISFKYVTYSLQPEVDTYMEIFSVVINCKLIPRVSRFVFLIWSKLRSLKIVFVDAYFCHKNYVFGNIAFNKMFFRRRFFYQNIQLQDIIFVTSWTCLLAIRKIYTNKIST